MTAGILAFGAYIPRLRLAITDLYQRKFDVALDPESQVCVTIGAKEGFSHLMWVLLGPGDTALVPSPSYPIHIWGPILAGAAVHYVRMGPGQDFFGNLLEAYEQAWPRPRVIVTSFPHNPTTACVDLAFMEELVEFARERDIVVVHDFAYADLGFDGYEPPSILQVPGAKDVAVELSLPEGAEGLSRGTPLIDRVPRIPGLSIEQSGDRDSLFDEVTVTVDRSTLPTPVRSDTPLDVRVDGVATHVLGWMRRGVRDEDLKKREDRLETDAAFHSRVCTDDGADRGAYRADERVGSAGIESACEADLRGPSALLVGNEGSGLPKEVMVQADEVVAIPQSSRVESLNAGIAASIILYEAARQRINSPPRH